MGGNRTRRTGRLVRPDDPVAQRRDTEETEDTEDGALPGSSLGGAVLVVLLLAAPTTPQASGPHFADMYISVLP